MNHYAKLIIFGAGVLLALGSFAYLNTKGHIGLQARIFETNKTVSEKTITPSLTETSSLSVNSRETTSTSIKHTGTAQEPEIFVTRVSPVRQAVEVVTETVKNLITISSKTSIVEGKLIISMFENLSTSGNFYSYAILGNDNKLTPLIIDNSVDRSFLVNNMPVRIEGIKSNGSIHAKSVVPTGMPVTERAPSGERSITGPRNVSIILFRFANSSGNPSFTAEDSRKTVFEKNITTGLTMSEFLNLSTHGGYSIEGKTSPDGITDVYGWYTTNVSLDGCYGITGYEYDDAARDAVRQAIQDGLVVSKGDLLMAFTSEPGCPGGGRGRFVSTNGYGLTDPQATSEYVPMTIMNGLGWGNTLHEIGHLMSSDVAMDGVVNTMVYHSNTRSCSNFEIFDLSQGCQDVEYGSRFSIMGGYASGATKDRLFDASNLEQAGYIAPQDIITASVSGIYSVKKQNYQNFNVVHLPLVIEPSYAGTYKLATIKQVERYKTSYLSISTRDFYPFEQDVQTSPHQNLVFIHLGDRLIKPNSSKWFLAPGEQMTMNQLGVSIKNLGPDSANPQHVRIQITYLKTKLNVPGVTFEITKFPKVAQLNSSGKITTQPILSIKNISGRPVRLSTASAMPILKKSERLYPTTGNHPLDMTTFIPADPVSGITLYHGAEESFPLINSFQVDSSILQNVSKALYRYKNVVETVDPLGNNIYGFITHYLSYGSFSPTELMNHGIITPTDINISPGSIINTNSSVSPINKN